LGRDLQAAADRSNEQQAEMLRAHGPEADADELTVTLYAEALILRTAEVELRNEERRKPKPARMRGYLRNCDLAWPGDAEMLASTQRILGRAVGAGTEPPWLVDLLTHAVAALRGVSGGAEE